MLRTKVKGGIKHGRNRGSGSTSTSSGSSGGTIPVPRTQQEEEEAAAALPVIDEVSGENVEDDAAIAEEGSNDEDEIPDTPPPPSPPRRVAKKSTSRSSSGGPTKRKKSKSPSPSPSSSPTKFGIKIGSKKKSRTEVVTSPTRPAAAPALPSSPFSEVGESQEVQRRGAEEEGRNISSSSQEEGGEEPEDIIGSPERPGPSSRKTKKGKSNGNLERRSKSKSPAVRPVPQEHSSQLHQSMLQSDSEEEEMSAPTPFRRRMSGVGDDSMPLSVASDSSVVSNRTGTCSTDGYDPNDPRWLKFLGYVKTSPDTAHERIARECVDLGKAGEALLGRLVYRSLNAEMDGDVTGTPELYDKCALALLHAVLTATIHLDQNTGVVAEMVNLILIEAPHFPTTVLYSAVDSCLKYMRRDKDSDGSLPSMWLDVFGRIVSVLAGRGSIQHEMDIIDGKSYKEYIVNEICRLEWTADNTASLIAAFRSLSPLEDGELKMVLHQVKSCAKNFKAAAFPPIVHQLIKLAGSKNVDEVLALCSEYFGSVNFSDDSSLEVRQKRNTMGTVVFHFLDAERNANSVLKPALNLIKASLFDFGEVMNPFILSVILGLSRYDYCKVMIVDFMKKSILKSFHSTDLSRMSYWYERTSGDKEDLVTKNFRMILESRAAEIEYMLDGLRELGLCLLNTQQLQNKYPNIVNKCEQLGSYLVTSVVTQDPMQLKSTVSQLVNCSFTSKTKSFNSTKCLASCLKKRTRQLVGPSMLGCASDLIRQFPMMDPGHVELLVKGLLDALKLNRVLLDTLIVGLRKTKSLWKSVESRRSAAKIMVILLSNAKLIGEIPLSQYSASQRMLDSEGDNFTQTQTHVQVPELDSDPLCLEILTFTKGVLMQQPEIREELYLGFHNVVRKNPELCEMVCSQIFNHAEQYIVEEDQGEDKTCRIKFSSIFGLHPTTNLLQVKDELGFLVQCMGLLVIKSTKAFHNFPNRLPQPVKKLQNLLRQIITAVLDMTSQSVEIIAAELVSAAGGSRPMEVVRTVETGLAIHIMQVIEALMEYLGIAEKEKDDRVLKRLFDKFTTIEAFLTKEKEKAPKQKGKGDKKGDGSKKGKENKNKSKDKSANDSDIDTDSQASGAGSTGGFRRPDAPKKMVHFYITDLESVLAMLRKLYGPESARGTLTIVSKLEKNEFERMLLSVVRQKLRWFIKKEPIHERNRHPQKIEEIFAEIVGAIWNGLISHNSDDEEAGIEIEVTDIVQQRLELIDEITCYLCDSSELPVACHLIRILADEADESLSYDQTFPKFFVAWKTIQGWIPMCPADADKDVQKYLFDVLAHFAKPLSIDSGDFKQSSEVANWLWNYISTSAGKKESPDFMLAESACSCWLTYFMKGKGFLKQPGGSQHDLLTLATAVRAQLGMSEEFEPNSEVPVEMVKLWIVNQDSAPTVLCVIMNHVELQLNHISVLHEKLKHHPMDNDRALKKASAVRDSCLNMISQILEICTELILSNFPAGLCSRTLLKVIPQIFDTLSRFAEYLEDLAKANINFPPKVFATLVDYIHKSFQGPVEVMVQHIERVQRVLTEEAIEKAQSSAKAGKVVIPRAVKNQFILDSKLISDLIFSVERYDQRVLQLSNVLEKKGKKTSLLLCGMKMSILHDFKIDHGKFNEAMQRLNRPRSVQEMTTVNDSTTQDDTTTAENAGSSRKRKAGPATGRVRKGRKRKQSENEEPAAAEDNNDPADMEGDDIGVEEIDIE